MVTKDMLIADVLKLGDQEELAATLMGFGMHCIGCMLAHGETIEQAAEVHGLNPDEIVHALNKIIPK